MFTGISSANTFQTEELQRVHPLKFVRFERGIRLQKYLTGAGNEAIEAWMPTENYHFWLAAKSYILWSGRTKTCYARGQIQDFLVGAAPSFELTNKISKKIIVLKVLTSWWDKLTSIKNKNKSKMVKTYLQWGTCPFSRLPPPPPPSPICQWHNSPKYICHSMMEPCPIEKFDHLLISKTQHKHAITTCFSPLKKNHFANIIKPTFAPATISSTIIHLMTNSLSAGYRWVFVSG